MDLIDHKMLLDYKVFFFFLIIELEHQHFGLFILTLISNLFFSMDLPCKIYILKQLL